MKTTKLLLASLGTLSLAAACVGDRTSIEVKGAYADMIDSKCVTLSSASAQQEGGTIDVGWTDRYHMGILIHSNLDGTDLTLPGGESNPSARNDFFIEQIQLTYTCKDSSAACLAFPKTTPVLEYTTGLVSAGGDLYFGTQVFNHALAQGLVQSMCKSSDPSNCAASVATSPVISTYITVQFSGHFSSGGAFTTEPFNFPIDIVASQPQACTDPAVRVVVTGSERPPCSNFGQDRFYGVCATPSTSP